MFLACPRFSPLPRDDLLAYIDAFVADICPVRGDERLHFVRRLAAQAASHLVVCYWRFGFWFKTRFARDALIPDDTGAEHDAVVADEDAGSGNELGDLVLRLETEGAPAVSQLIHHLVAGVPIKLASAALACWSEGAKSPTKCDNMPSVKKSDIFVRSLTTPGTRNV